MQGTLDAASQALLMEALDSLRVGVAVFDADDVLVYCNEHYRYVYRSFASVDELIGKRFADIVRLKAENREIAGDLAVSDIDAWVAERVAQHRCPSTRRIEQRLTDGRWMEIKERSIAGGGIIGLWSDITSAKRIQIRLEETIESTGDGFAVWDQAGRLTAFNERFAKLHEGGGEPVRVGETLAELLDRGIEHGLIRVDGDVEAWIGERLRNRQRIESESVIEFAGDRWMLVKNRRTREGGVVTVFSDITELKRGERDLIERGATLRHTVNELEMVQSKLEDQATEIVEMAEGLDEARQEAESASRAKSSFLAVMSHELRTPLNAIIGFSELIRDETFGPVGNDRYLDYIKDINRSGAHLLELINDVLDLSKIDAGGLELREDLVDVARVTQGSLDMVRERAEKRGLSLELDVPAELPGLHGDGRRIKQIVINLLTNAIKFTGNGGAVRVEIVLDPDGALLISVSDTGIGIAPDDIPKALERFGQVDNKLSRDQEGTGLGLNICTSLMEMHGGTLELESEAGVGTTVTLRFPADRVRHIAA